MAKLFKTISLEERYKESLNNQLPIKPKGGNQGTIVLQPIKPSKELESSLLKTIPNAIEKNSIVLRGLLKKTESILPFINTKFRTAISLADRLLQTKTGSTQHLAQYFLSDTYSNYIKITPFGIFNHISTTIVQPVKTNITQGGENPTIFNTITNQGLVYVGGAASSFINITVPAYNSLLLQGAFYSNGVYTTKITTTNISLKLTNQGPGTDPKQALSLLILASLQGPGTEPKLAKTLIQSPGVDFKLAIPNIIILQRQGTVTFNNNVTSLIIPSRPMPSPNLNQGPQDGANRKSKLFKEEHMFTTPTDFWLGSDKGRLTAGVNTNTYTNTGEPAPNAIGRPKEGIRFLGYITARAGEKIFDNTYNQLETNKKNPKNKQSPVLKALAYAADRALAFYAPRVKHGDADLSEAETTKGYFNKLILGDSFAGNDFDGANDATDRSAQVKANLKVMVNLSPGEPGDSEGLEEYLNKQAVPDDKTIPDHQKVKYVDEVLGVKSTPIVSQTTLFNQGDVNSDKEGMLQTKSPGDFEKANPYFDQQQASLSDYRALAYGEIKTKQETIQPGVFVRGKGEFAPDEGIDRRYFSLLNTVNHAETRRGAQQSLRSAEYPTNLDFKIARKHKDGLTGALKEQAVNAPQLKHSEDRGGIDLLIKSLTLPGIFVKFKPYITSFSDGFTVAWNDLNYVGRQDTLKTFKGTTRAGNIAFKLPAYSQGELTANYAKLQNLVKIAGVGSAQGGYIAGPFCNITVGKWFKDTPCIFNSIKFDVQMAEYSWDILQQRPQIVDVAMDFVLLGDTTGAPLNSSTNQYFASLT